MLKNIFLTSIAAITVVTTAAMATNGDKTVASKSYVDTKQVMIPATGTNSSTLGDTVVTYTSTAGTIGERGIATSAGDDADDLVSLGLLNNFAEYAEETFVFGDSLTEATVHDLTCVDNDCELYNVTEMTVYKPKPRARLCSTSSDCDCYENGQFVGQQSCQNGECTGACRML